MDVIVVRHGIAMDRDEAAENVIADEDRPLTPKGRRRMKAAARALADLATGAELLFSSSLLRAVQTAKIVRRAFEDDIGYRETPALLPHAEPSELARVLSEGSGMPSVLVVGTSRTSGASWGGRSPGKRRSSSSSTRAARA